MSLFEKILIYQKALFSILIASSAYILYYFISQSNRLKKKFIHHFGEKKTKIYWVLLQRGAGILLYGIIPASAALGAFSKGTFTYGLSLANLTESLCWAAALSAFIIPISFGSAKKSSLQHKYPQIKTHEWNIGLILMSTFSWALYLFAYELLLRGILFFSCLEAFGLWAASAINVIIYALFHLHKEHKEMVGSVLLGLVFCMITYKTKAIWAAFIIHFILAISHEWALIYFNPEIKLKWIRNRK